MNEYTLHLGDCLEYMRGMEAGSVQLVIADPPYHDIANEEWDKQWRNVRDWATWCGEWGAEAARILSDTGSFYGFGDDKNIAYMQVAFDGLDWGLVNNIVWSKTNYTALKSDPMALRSYRVQGEERILFYGKDISFPSFSEIRNPKAAQPMAEYLRSERIRAAVPAREIAALFPSVTGGLTGCVSNWELGLNFPLREQYETIRDYLNKSGRYDYLRREYEDLRREYEDLRREYEDLRRPFYGNNFTDIWTGAAINGGAKYHPTQKPEWIIKRIILASTNPGDVVLDPFMGSGTTGKIAIELGRRFIGCENVPGYFAIAEKRIREAAQQPALFVHEPQPKPTQTKFTG